MLFAWVLNQFLGASAPSSSSSNTVESAASIDLEANQLGRRIPAYFKILTFIPDRWDIFADKFIEHPVAQQIKKNLQQLIIFIIVYFFKLKTWKIFPNYSAL